MAASEYVVASRYPSLYIETVTGDKPTSALSTGDRYTDLDGLTSEWNGAAWVDLPAGGAVTPAVIHAAVPGLRSGNPWHFVGTWDADYDVDDSGPGYMYGDAVRYKLEDDWELWISKVDHNVDDPEVDSATWEKPTDSPVVVEGTVNPNGYGEQTRITEYSTGGATGGDFTLGGGDAIAWDADAAAILAALGDAAIAVVGNADDPTFTVENFSDALDIDGTNLTGGGATSQEGTQDFVVGGFTATPGSIYLDASGDIGQLWTYDSDDESWVQGFKALRASAMEGDADARSQATRIGTGQGDAETSSSATRGESGAGDAESGLVATRSGSGVGNAHATAIAQVTDTADGYASAIAKADHYIGGIVSIGPYADATGANILVTGLPTADPMVAGAIWLDGGVLTISAA